MEIHKKKPASELGMDRERLQQMSGVECPMQASPERYLLVDT